MRSRTGPCFSPLGAAFIVTLLVSGLQGADFSPRTHVYKRVNGLEIRADVHVPTTGAEPRPVVVYLHGGSLINGHRQSIEKWRPTSALLEAGVVVVSLDYRLAPETKLPGIVADVEDGFRWVREQGPGLFGVDPQRVAVAGSSAGGYLALVAATRVPGLRVVMAEMSYGDLLAEWQMRPSVHRPHYEDSHLSEAEAWRQVSGPPVANVRDRVGDGSAFNDFIRRTAQWPKAITGWDPRTEAERYAPYLPVKHVTPAHPPTFLLHGRNDSDVPFSQPQAMAAEFARHGVKHRLVGIEGAEHGWRGVAAEIVAARQREGTEFLLDHLLPDRRSGALPPTETHVYKQVGDLQIRADVNRARRAVSGPPVANAAERKGSQAAFNQYCRRQGLWPKAVTGWDPVADAAQFLPYLPLRKVDSAFPPTFLIHGEADTDVPCEQSVLMAAELSRHGVEHRFIPVPGAEHGLKGSDPTPLFSLEQQAAAFLLGHLKPATAVAVR
ncbi:MAG: alpha/beta hydrolase [Opitutaceae bacterium]|nr:alpha/beta hydrolase [Opitutaceae bacterium]